MRVGDESRSLSFRNMSTAFSCKMRLGTSPTSSVLIFVVSGCLSPQQASLSHSNSRLTVVPAQVSANIGFASVDQFESCGRHPKQHTRASGAHYCSSKPAAWTQLSTLRLEHNPGPYTNFVSRRTITDVDRNEGFAVQRPQASD